jgi:hypothetical protein
MSATVIICSTDESAATDGGAESTWYEHFNLAEKRKQKE